MGKRHTTTFKLHAVEKAQMRGSDQSIAEIAEHHHIGYSTLTRWMQEVKEGKLTEESPEASPKNKRPQQWTIEEKLQGLIDTERLSEQDKSRYCRRHGIYVHQLEDWKKALKDKQSNSNDSLLRNEIRELKAQNKRLEKELARKEKALAEAAALIVLKKKAHALLDPDAED
jgi:transposase-like protein